MLIEFSVSNFKSIGEKVTFSMVGSSSATKRDGITHHTNNSLAPNVLVSSVLFGPNASGKSSFIESLSFMRDFVLSSAGMLTHGDLIGSSIYNFTQNKLIDTHKKTEFELKFLYEDEIYIYGFSLDTKRVFEEWLFARKSLARSKPRTIFTRSYNSKKDNYDWDIDTPSLTGDKITWRQATRSNALFLSTAIQLNSQSLIKPFDWFQNKLNIIMTTSRVNYQYTVSLISDHKGYEEKILDFMEALDFRIKGFKLEYDESILSYSRQSPKFEIEGFINRGGYRLSTLYKNSKGQEVIFQMPEESQGTQVIIGLVGHILTALETGGTLFIDELNNSLHPHILEGLVQIFHDEEQNPKGAQLIFSSHDTHIISEDVMHKDQIWFFDRCNGIATTIVPLSDYKTDKMRKTESFSRPYHRGKFGAIPSIRDF